MFMAGIVPGLLMGFSLFAASMWVTRKSRLLRAPKASAANRWAAFKDAFWGLMMPGSDISDSSRLCGRRAFRKDD